MISNQIAGYNGRFRFDPRELCQFVQSLVQSLEMRELSCNIYIFSLLEQLVMAETPKQISNVNASASCATF